MIEPLSPDNIEEFLPLIRQYQDFYGAVDICDSKKRSFFSQFTSDSKPSCLFAYRDRGELIAFARVYFSFVSSIPAKVGIMNDLFTLESYLRLGIAKKLIEHCHRYAVDNGAARLQWLTAASNLAAQKVYEGIGPRANS